MNKRTIPLIVMLIAVSIFAGGRAAVGQQSSTSGSNAAVEAAIVQFDAGDWLQAVQGLEALLESGKLGPVARTRARKYAALGHLIIKDTGWERATVRIFKDLVGDDPTFGIPNLALPGEEPHPEAIRLLGQAFFEWREEELARTEARLRANTRSSALLRSSALPGWGQRYQGHRGRGWAIFGLAAGSVAYAVVADRSYRDARDNYDGAQIGEDFDVLYQDYRDKADVADLAVGLVVAAWGLNLLDAALSGPNLSGLNSVSVAPRLTGGVQLAYRVEF